MSKRTKGTALQAFFNIKYNLPMNRVKQIWNAQEKAYREMIEDEQYCHHESFRWGFEQGVDWAEKDLALTWEDAATIVTIAMDIIGEGKIHGEQNIYTEVLKRFNEHRNGKSD